MKLSIIIPTYNMEKYIERCLKSCINQTVSKDLYEIVVINDGSTDKSLHIIEKTLENQPNVVIHTQNNGGLSSARNKGLLLANGEYIWFVDADDWIHDNSLMIIFQELSNNNLDILEFDAYNAYEINNKVELHQNKFYNSIKSDIISGVDFIKEHGFIVGVCFKVIRRSHFEDNKLSFPLNVYNEDYIISYRLTRESLKYKKMDVPLYYYYNRGDSITNSRDNKHLIKYYNDILDNLIEMQKIITKEKISTSKLREMQSFYTTNLIFGVLRLKSKNQKLNYLRILEKNELYPIKKYKYHNNGLKRNIFVLLINIKVVFYLFASIRK